MLILAVDGGGILGLTSALVLADIEGKIEGRRLRSHFDLMAGTSTGGILASALAKGLPASDIVDLYLDDGPKIFDKSFLHEVYTGKKLWGPEYDNTNLKESLQKTFGNTWLSDLGPSAPDLLVPYYDIEARNTKFFKSSKAHEDPYHDFQLKDVTLLTSSAPTYFPPGKAFNRAGGRVWAVDGGMFCNNPTMAAIAEAQSLGVELKHIHVLSIGTRGNEKRIDPYDAMGWGVIGWARPAFEIFMDGQRDNVHYWAKTLLPKNNYHRLSVPVTDHLLMDSVAEEDLKTMVCDTRTYLHRNRVLMQEIAQLIADN